MVYSLVPIDSTILSSALSSTYLFTEPQNNSFQTHNPFIFVMCFFSVRQRMTAMVPKTGGYRRRRELGETLEM